MPNQKQTFAAEPTYKVPQPSKHGINIIPKRKGINLLVQVLGRKFLRSPIIGKRLAVIKLAILSLNTVPLHNRRSIKVAQLQIAIGIP